MAKKCGIEMPVLLAISETLSKWQKDAV